MDRARNSHRSSRGESRMTILAKIVSLLSLTRVYNIALIAAAQYLSCIFFFTSRPPDFSVLTDPHFFVLVVCTWMTIAAGYIINFFYDKNKDLVNSPVKSRIDGFVSQATTLKLYLTLNALAVAASLYVSLRSGVFFAGFAFLLWFYSHKLKKIPLVSNLSLAAVAIVPLFAVFFYRKIVDIQVVVSHGLFLFFLLVAMSLLNDLNNRRGDAVFGYRTLPVVWGERAAASAAAERFFPLFSRGRCRTSLRNGRFAGSARRQDLPHDPGRNKAVDPCRAAMHSASGRSVVVLKIFQYL